MARLGKVSVKFGGGVLTGLGQPSYGKGDPQGSTTTGDTAMTTTIIQTNGTVLYESQAGTMSEAITEAIRAGVSLAGANLYGEVLYKADLTNANLAGADLRHAILSDTYIYKADLTNANLRGADLRGADLTNANLAGAIIEGAFLRGADLKRADLKRADLRGADLTGANLRGADLTGANLYGANLTGANLRGADLTGANLHKANLTDTTFARVANITDSCSAIGIIDAGTDSRGYRWVAVQHDDGPRIYAGCRWFTLSEAHAHWDREHADGEDVAIECRARLALLETLITTKGW